MAPSNRLAGETSPYLLQHARNPVDWYPWGDEAFARARAENKPILLSIGYSACHWCHVMERESFEDPAIAALMNELFVSIKVDREERPDVDDVYMKAVQILIGRGGWPLTAFLTPDRKPFHGGTYFPPSDRHGMPGFPRVLRAVARAYHERPELREPPKGEGSPLRAFVLIAILGGLALAGGLYFGNGGLPNFGQDRTGSQPQEPASVPSLEPPSAPESGGTSLSQLATPSRAAPMPQPQQRREPQPQPQRVASSPAPRDLNATASATTSAPRTPSGGPVSLFGPQSNTSQAQGGSARVGVQNGASAVSPQQDSATVVAMNAPPPAVQAPTPLGAVRWTSRPTARRIADLYPNAAARQSVGGRVELNCTVTSSLSLACGVASESPPGLGFGRAALSVANSYRVAPVLSDGGGAVGARTRIAVQFQAPQQ